MWVKWRGRVISINVNQMKKAWLLIMEASSHIIILPVLAQIMYMINEYDETAMQLS